MISANPVSSKERFIILDALRGWALLDIYVRHRESGIDIRNFNISLFQSSVFA